MSERIVHTVLGDFAVDRGDSGHMRFRCLKSGRGYQLTDVNDHKSKAFRREVIAGWLRWPEDVEQSGFGLLDMHDLEPLWEALGLSDGPYLEEG